MSTASKTEVVKGKKDDMKGKNIVVTGANSGIGLALSKALVSRGAHVTVAARDDAKGAEYALSNCPFAHIDYKSASRVDVVLLLQAGLLVKS